MSKKILYVASTFIHIKHFHIPYIEQLIALGYDVHIMACGDSIDISSIYKIHHVNFHKSMFSLKNIKTTMQIAKIIKDEKYDVVYIHTSLAAFFTRLGIMFSPFKPKLVINMVHGYLFDNKSSLLKRNIMLMAEKFTKSVTDVIMVMNQEDFEIATKHKLCKENVHFIDGVGVDFTRFPSKYSFDVIKIKETHGYRNNDFLLVYTAEFSKRKNQQFLINAVSKLKSDGYPIKMLLLGNGSLMDDCIQQVKDLNLQNEVVFVGYTRETPEYYQISDVCVSSSRSEGLPFNIMEAMSSGLPIVATKVKGHTDLITPNENGYLFEFDNLGEFTSHIKTLYDNRKLCTEMGQKSVLMSRKYAIDIVKPQIIDIIEKEYKSHK